MKEAILKKLGALIAIESVSTDPKRAGQILLATVFLKKELESLGCKVTILKSRNSPPLIIGELLVNPNSKTIGIYGHYDVQPENPVNQWHSPPFQLARRNGKLYARGVADNKGHIIQNIAAIRKLLDGKKVANNIIFIFEGEEETGSINLEKYLIRYKEILQNIAVFFITDVGMRQKNTPQIFYGLRGIATFELTITTGKREVHSGVFGNRVYNPAQLLVTLFASMKDQRSQKVTIPGFYDQVRAVSKGEADLLLQVGVSDSEIRSEAEAFTLLPKSNIPTFMKSKIFPSLELHGIQSGYTDEGVKTIIPYQAEAKFSCRLVPDQKPKEIIILVSEYIKRHLPKNVQYGLKSSADAFPFYMSLDDPYVKKTATILSDFFGQTTKFNRSGGSIPAAEIFQRLFQKPIILTGFTLPDDNIHAPNENFDEEMFWKGIDVLAEIYSQI